MKRKICVLPLAAVVLAGCAAAAVDTTPVWQQQLPQTGVDMQLSNCELVGEEPVYYALERSEGDQWEERPALQTEGVPVVTFYGASPEEVQLRFVENIDTLYLYYDKVMPQQDLDYIVTELPDGGLQFELDTVYNYEFVVTTRNGEDSMIVTCHRDGLTK